MYKKKIVFSQEAGALKNIMKKIYAVRRWSHVNILEKLKL